MSGETVRDSKWTASANGQQREKQEDINEHHSHTKNLLRFFLARNKNRPYMPTPPCHSSTRTIARIAWVAVLDHAWHALSCFLGFPSTRIREKCPPQPTGRVIFPSTAITYRVLHFAVAGLLPSCQTTATLKRDSKYSTITVSLRASFNKNDLKPTYLTSCETGEYSSVPLHTLNVGDAQHFNTPIVFYGEI